MRDIGGLIWLIFIVVGVISSIVQSARKQQAARQARQPTVSAPRPVPQGAATQPLAAAPKQVRVVTQSGNVSPQVARLLEQFAAAAQATAPQPPPQPAPQPKPKPVPPPAAPPVESAQTAAQAFVTARPSRPHVARLFGDKRALVRAVIAAEVLGKPRALRDE